MLEEANTIYLPFVGEFEIDGAASVVLLVGGLIGGLTVYNWADEVGQNVAETANSFITNLVGSDPTGDDEGGVQGV